MNRSHLTALLLAILAAAGGSHAATERILIIGDSWAASIATDNADPAPAPAPFASFDRVLVKNGYPGIVTRGTVTALSGRKAAYWAQAAHLAEIAQELTQHTSLDIVHLVIGGNDFLGTVTESGFIGKTPEEREAVWNGIEADIQAIVDRCLSVRADLRVVIAGYDYLDAAAATLAWGFDFHGATQAQLNTWFVELGQKQRRIAEATARCEYVQCFGLLQHAYGDPSGFPLPGQAPDYTPFPGGDMGSPMPAASHVGDGIHPHDEGHQHLLQSAMDQYYTQWLFESDYPYPFIEVPQGGAFEEGSEVTLAVAVAGLYGKVSYEWFHNGNPVEGGGKASFIVENFGVDATGRYVCRVTGEAAKAAYETEAVKVEIKEGVSGAALRPCWPPAPPSGSWPAAYWHVNYRAGRRCLLGLLEGHAPNHGPRFGASEAKAKGMARDIALAWPGRNGGFARFVAFGNQHP